MSQASATSDGWLSKDDWNRFNAGGGGGGTGPQGPPGPQGPAGPQGPQGPAGVFTVPITFAGHWRVKADGTFQLWNPDQSLWHTLQVRGAAGAEYITVGAGET